MSEAIPTNVQLTARLPADFATKGFAAIVAPIMGVSTLFVDKGAVRVAHTYETADDLGQCKKVEEVLKAITRCVLNSNPGLSFPPTTTCCTGKIYDLSSTALYDFCPSTCATVLAAPLRMVEQQKPNVICVSETWLNDSIPNGCVLPSGYNIFRRDCVSSSHGGVLIAVKEDLICSNVPALSTDSECIWVSVQSKSAECLIGSAYRAPNLVLAIAPLARSWHPTALSVTQLKSHNNLASLLSSTDSGLHL
ncbi:hypothetical protein B566_EDAN006556 [Ephemera danica]|nr:hypothetical protein B566_EDAN006556 [Ephemera danica]